jgi:transcription antitermination protein NusB
MSRDRRSYRILAMQALCQWEIQHDESSPSLADFLASQDASPRASVYASKLVQEFWRQRTEIDERVGTASVKWDLVRISPVERNIMRVAIVELLNGEIPPPVILDEAIEIGREYGGAESPRFINGVLDAVFKSMQAAMGKGT